MFDFWWLCARSARRPYANETSNHGTAGSKKIIERHDPRDHCPRELSGKMWIGEIKTKSRKGISDVHSGSISGTISATLPPLSPGARPGFWLRGRGHARAMGTRIPAGKKSHGGSRQAGHIGSGFDSDRSRRLQALFCEASLGRVGLLKELNNVGTKLDVLSREAVQE
jgi:hypothetical protein